MHIAIVGSGAVGGYYGARLVHAGQQVTFIARGAQLRAIRDRGLLVFSPLGDIHVTAPAESDTGRVGPVDAVLFAVKSYDLESAVGLLPPLLGPETVVLTLQNGVDAPEQVANAIGPDQVIGGATYIGTAILAPGVIEQTGAHRRIVLGEVFRPAAEVSPRVLRLADVLSAADIQIHAVGDVRPLLWEKFIFLASLATMAAAARMPTGGVWGDPVLRAQTLAAMREIERVARAQQVPIAPGTIDHIADYCGSLPGAMRPSMLIDLTAGKPLEIEALPGSVVRRGAAAGVPTPVMETLYAVLKPHAAGRGAVQPVRHS